MHNNSSLLASKQSLGTNQFPVSRKGSKLAAVEDSLIEMFKKQQRGFVIPHKPIKVEKETPERSFIIDAVPVVQELPPSPPQKHRNHPEGLPHKQLTKKNMELFDQQQKLREKENMIENTPMTQLDGHRKNNHHHKDVELAKLRNTIDTYEANTNNLMKTLYSERESYKAATKQLQKTNESLKTEVSRIERSLREVLNKRDDELRLNERFRLDNDELVTRNLRLQHDLDQALQTIDKSEQLLNEMKGKLEHKRAEKMELEEQNKDLQTQLERVRMTMNAWTTNTQSGPEKTVAQAMTCAVSKLIFFGSIIAIGLAALLQVVQASPEIDCDYVREALSD